jgi:DNA-binding CsgD family transcriptional regulator
VEQIAGARYVELHDPCHLLFSPALDRVMAVVDEMLDRPMAIEPPSRRVLTTVLFADVAARHVAVRQIALHGGVEATTPAPGVVATFDSPTTAVRCALAIAGDAARAQILARLGVHAGEIELLGGDVRGATVELAGRIAALAATGQVIVTRPVVDLVADTTVRFEALGEHQPRGLGPRRALFAATTAPQPLRDMPPPPQARLAELSPREQEVLAQLATGASNAEIAAALFMSEATVKAHVSHLFTKLGYTNRVQLALFAHRTVTGA